MNTAPLERLLMASADRDGEALVTAAREEAEALVAHAHAEADARVADAARAAREGVTARRARRLATARGDAHALVVTAQGAAVTSASAAAGAAADGLRTAPRYGLLVDGLAARARRVLGPAAVVDREPRGGGVIARRDRELVDLTLPVLLRYALEEHGAELEALWQ